MKLRIAFMSIALVFHAYHIVIIVRKYFLDKNDGWLSPWIIIFIATGVVRLVMDSYIFVSAFRYFFFIIRRRILKYKHNEGKVPLKTKLKMSWMTFVVILAALEVASVFVMSVFLTTTNSKILLKILIYQRYVVFPIFELTFSSTITYIFYIQSLELKRTESIITDPRRTRRSPSTIVQ